MAAPDRTMNASLAAAYNSLPYDPIALPNLEVDRLIGVSALFGIRPAVGDTLDIGCGSGVQLEAIAPHTTGRLVGIDISETACARARERLAPFGDRVEIRCCDATEIAPERLGQFDLIYCVGTLYVIPLEVREAMLGLIGRALRANGLFVTSYYAGTFSRMRASLHHSLRNAADSTASVGSQIASARAKLNVWRQRIEAEGNGNPYLIAAIESCLRLQDVMFFHEVFNPAFDTLLTTQLERDLAGSRMEFLTYLSPLLRPRADSRARALEADVIDYMGGAYRFVLFGKPADRPLGFDIRAPDVVWHSRLTREEQTYAPATTFVFDDETTVTIRNMLTQAVLDVLSEGPITLALAIAEARARLDRRSILPRPDDDVQLNDSLHFLWGKTYLHPAVEQP